MKPTIKWLNEALAAKDLVTGMTCYRVGSGMIAATDGRVTACHPWSFGGGEFLVPGDEFEKVLGRMPDTPALTLADDGALKMRSGRFSGTIRTLPVGEWNYPGVEDAQWKAVPKGLPPLLRALRTFISDNAIQPWAMCVALENGWSYATNNVAIAGAPCQGLDGIMALLPCWAVDFVLGRLEGLESWAWTEHYVAFKWRSGAWMRSQLVVGQFPEKAAAMVRQAASEQPGQKIEPIFRAAFERVAELAEDTVIVYADRIESCFGKARVQEETECEVPAGGSSIWGARYLLPALQAADSWSPASWPAPAAFKGPVVAGYVVGRRV